MKGFRFIYILVGLILVIGTFATGEYGLSKVNQRIYDSACDTGEKVAQIQFPDFHVTDYKVRFYDGSRDYVVQGDKIEKEQAALDTFAGTTLKIDGKQQVIVPEYELFSELFNMAGTAEAMAEGIMAFSENTYSEASHAATICHEAFHAWQFTKWEQEIEELMRETEMVGEKDREAVIVNYIDSDPALVVSFEKEMELLQAAYECMDEREKVTLVQKALEVHTKRQTELLEGVTALEEYLENLEGSAMYVEAMVYRSLAGAEAFTDYYLDDFIYSNGSGKYYSLGMLKCMLLDQLSPDWKENWNLEQSVDVLLNAACQ